MGCPALPACRTGHDVPGSSKYLPDGSSFFLFDGGADNVHGRQIYATDSGLAKSAINNSWACHGTLREPLELFTVQAALSESCPPHVFAVLPNKQEAAYQRLFFCYFLSYVQTVDPPCASWIVRHLYVDTAGSTVF